ncbi:DUF7693 family protein [Pseudomonas mandelii]|uniref:DUF7693 family protein n=1 Tax=Pseudomonas mandelii TaxID=75612 RepID=UPI001E2BB7F1|nr:hypothetical protein [Pseudomonas mandelii]
MRKEADQVICSAHSLKIAKTKVGESRRKIALARERKPEALKVHLYMNILNTTSLTAREVCRVLTEVTRGKRIMTRSTIQSWSEIYHGLMPVEIDGWHLTLFNDCDTLDYCEYCMSPDRRVGSLETWQRYGTDPVELLSAWEREQLERLLNAL